MKYIILFLACVFIFETKTVANATDTMRFGAFGKVTIYLPSRVPEAVVLFASGDGGWNEGVVDMARNIVAQGALVAGIDIIHYFKSIKSLNSKCYYPAGDFEELSLTIQKKYKLKQYLKPILVGYSSGATLVYGLLAQAPANTFKGSISLGFCPDIETDRPLCNGTALKSHVLKEGKSYYLDACGKLTAPFIVLEGMTDQVCVYEDTRKFLEDVPGSELVSLANVGHGFSVQKNWLPQFIAAYQKILKEPGYAEKLATQNQLLQGQQLVPLDKELPLILVPSSDTTNLPMVFFISGDGGWTSFDEAICEKLAEKGMPVAGLDAQKYFWNRKEPQEAAGDFSEAIEHYMQQWKKDSFILVGYSFGACVAPFIADLFSDTLKRTIRGVYCFSPDATGDFEIHISDMLSLKTDENYNVPEEMKKIKELKPICIFGNEEDTNLRNLFINEGLLVETLPGNHHYNDDFNALSVIILKDFPPGN